MDRQTDGGLTHLRLTGNAVLAETFKFHENVYDHVIYTVHEDRDESVWIGTLTGGARHIVQGVVQSISKRDGPGSDSVSAIEEGDDGAMYFGTPDGLSVVTRDHWSHYSANRGPPSGAEGGTNLFELKYFDHIAYLAQSPGSIRNTPSQV